MTYALTRAVPLPARLMASLAIAALLAACGSGEQAVRNGPQDVHPSPSKLAKLPLYDCGTQGKVACE